MHDPITRPTRRRAALIALALSAVVAAPAAAHNPVPTITADHAYVADPLYPLTTANAIYARAADERTAMASTTKVMTLYVAALALDAGIVTLDDQVTISDVADQSDCSTCSLMEDIFGQPLQAGEVVRFEDLLYGMIIPSGNDAAYAIAEHVAEAVNDGSLEDFVDLMNEKAADLGLVDTHYTDPSGYDGVGHYTTARENAKVFLAAMGKTVARRVLASSVWDATTMRAGGGTKTYDLDRSFDDPGLEGYKNGSTPWCDGDASGCALGSVRRIGRRLLLATMQSTGLLGPNSGDAKALLDHGFRELFHPDYRGGVTYGAVTAQSTACVGAGKTVSAVLPSIGRTRLVSWTTNVNAQTYTKAGTGVAPAGALAPTTTSVSRDVEALALTSSVVVTATRVANDLELRLWNVPAGGTPTTIGTPVTTSATGQATSFEMARIDNTRFVSIQRTPTAGVVVRIWLRTAKGITRIGGRTLNTAAPVTEVEIAGHRTQQLPRFVTAFRYGNTGSVVLSSWELDGSKVGFRHLGTTGSFSNGPGISLVATNIERPADELFPDEIYAIASRPGGALAIDYQRVAWDGSVFGAHSLTTAGGIHSVDLASLSSSGLVTAVRLNDDTVKLIVWENTVLENGAIKAVRVSDHAATPVGKDLEVCATPTSLASGDVLTSMREGSTSTLRIRGWRIGDRPLVVPAGGG